MEFYGIKPLVNVYIPMERSTMFDGKTHEISTGPFSIAMWNCQRVRMRMGRIDVYWPHRFCCWCYHPSSLAVSPSFLCPFIWRYLEVRDPKVTMTFNTGLITWMLWGSNMLKQPNSFSRNTTSSPFPFTPLVLADHLPNLVEDLRWENLWHKINKCGDIKKQQWTVMSNK